MFTLRRSSAAAAAVVGLAWVVGSVTPAAALSGGHAANPADAPWFASVLLTDSGLSTLGAMTPALRAAYAKPVNREQYGGALVAPDKVVTAAHCVTYRANKPLPASSFTIRLGGAPLSDTTAPTVPVTGVNVSPSFRLNPNPAHPNDASVGAAVSDVAVLTLAQPVTTAPISLDTTTVASGTSLRAFGHGVAAGLPADQFRTDSLEVGRFTAMNTAEAAAQWKPAASQTGLLYFGDRTVYHTSGDSGGPVIRSGSGPAELVGVFSFGAEALASGTPQPGFAAATDASVIASMLR